jgi:hypothetical protein
LARKDNRAEATSKLPVVRETTEFDADTVFRYRRVPAQQSTGCVPKDAYFLGTFTTWLSSFSDRRPLTPPSGTLGNR